jgi:acetolactate synthase-1/2/3 large subunit
MLTTGNIIAKSLVANGVDRIFCVPGESYLGLLDAIYDEKSIDLVVCQHEASAGFMALADSRLTGRVGVECVSRGPGASHAAIAVHSAEQESLPFLLFIGQVPLRDIRRDAFQEIDYSKMFGSIAKWVAEVIDPDQIGEILLRAFQMAITERPGPVVVSVPEDILSAPSFGNIVKPQAKPRAIPNPADIVRTRHLLAASERPLIIAGSNLGQPGGREALMEFATKWNLPVAVSFRHQDLFPNNHRLFAGALGYSPKSQLELLSKSDLILVIGDHLSHVTTNGYTFPPNVNQNYRIIHVYPDQSIIGIHSFTELAISCDAISFIHALGEFEPGLPLSSPHRERWVEELRNMQTVLANPEVKEVKDGVPFELVIKHVGMNLAENAIITVDAGKFGLPIYQMIPFKAPQRLLGPISGSMGFGIPAAISASIRFPKCPVICFVGDGGFLMTGNALSVAIERRLPLKIILSENRMYGTVRAMQERQYPGRAIGTHFCNPDFELIGRAFGFEVTHIKAVEQLDLLKSALRSNGPQLVIVESSVEAILPKVGLMSKN